MKKFEESAQSIVTVKTKLRKKKEEFEILKKMQSENSSKQLKVRREIEELENELKALKPDKLSVTDHARVRYIERVYGVDISEVDKDILKQDKHRIKVRDNKVVTVILGKGGQS